jgi:glutamate/tyrosine decarboxylase-like PLP-dependent enzyme
MTLDPADWQSFRQQAHRMLDDIIGHLQGIGEQPVWQAIPSDVRRRFQSSVPREPVDLAAVHGDFLHHILPYSSGNTHPGFLGWLQGGGTAVGMLAGMLAAGMNANAGGRDHAAIEVERQVVAWMRELFGFPQSATGLFVTGTSMANLLAVVVARGGLSGRLTAYASKAAHGCIRKAMHICGFGVDALRLIATDEAQRMDLRELELTIEADRHAGFSPFLVIGTAGTVDAGAVDDLSALADLCERQRLWFHVDGACGAMAILAGDLAPKLKGIERADSLAFDFHKWAQVPYPAGFLLVRDGTLHRAAFSCDAAYLRRQARGLAGGAEWPCDLGIDLSRGFEALKTWFTFQVYGTRALGAGISQMCALARYLEERIRREAELEIMAPVALNIVCFRFRGFQADSLNARIVIELQEAGEIAPSTTTLNGELCIRAAIVNHRTTPRQMDLLVEKTLAAGRALLEKAEKCRAAEADDWAPHRLRLAELQRLEAALRESPEDIALQVEHATRQAELGRVEESRDEYLAVLRQEPAHRFALNQLGTLLYGTGYRTAARTVYAEAVAQHPTDAASLINLANVLVEDGEAERARELYGTALEIDETQAAAHQGLARALSELGDQQAAEQHRRAGFAGSSVAALPYRGAKAPVNVLLLVSALGGNPPVRRFLDDRQFQTFVLTADYYDESEPLPPHHVVFNAIGDADLCGRALRAAEWIVAGTAAPVINSPPAVAATGREANARRLRGVAGVVSPVTVMLPRDLLASSNAETILGRHGLAFPMLVRSPGFHTGQNFIRLERSEELPAALAELPGETLTFIEYLDSRGADGKIRKYRVMMIDGKLYPLHAAISGNWKIHYFTAEMAENRAHRAEDAAFLEDMAGVLGARAMAGLIGIEAALGLQYAGIDFGLNARGEVLLYEANATMVVPPPGPGGQWDYRRPAVERIYAAVRKMIAKNGKWCQHTQIPFPKAN